MNPKFLLQLWINDMVCRVFSAAQGSCRESPYRASNLVVRSLFKCSIFEFAVIVLVSALAACTTQPAMAPSHVAALHSGRLVINLSRHEVVIISRESLGEALASGLVAGVIGGPIGAAAASGGTVARSLSSSPILKPYAEQLTGLSFAKDFRTLGAEVAKTVPWIKQSSSVELSQVPGGLGAGAMRHRTQLSSVNAIAFVQPVIVFSLDMKWVAVRATVSVYARGGHGAVFLDGGRIAAATPLGKSGAPLGASSLDKLAQSHRLSDITLEARAKLWFVNDEARFESALTADIRLFKQRLGNYLNGRRTR